MITQASLITPKRRFFQYAAYGATVLLPFLTLNGKSVARLDIPNLRLFVLGHSFYLEDAQLFWLAGVWFVFCFLLTTFILGRVWCGWACPQTALCDLTEWVAKKIGLKQKAHRLNGTKSQTLLLQLFMLCLALFMGMVFVWYFIPPGEYFSRLFQARLGWWPLGTTLAIGLFTYLDLAVLRRTFCREFCPYGRFQTVLVDKGTLTLWYHPDEASRCIKCKACVNSCPMGIDIRNGFQIECINCAICLDACRKVMAKKNEKGIIRYTFGTEGRGWRALMSPRLLLIGLLFFGLSIGLLFASLNRPQVTLKIARAAQIPAKQLSADTAAYFFVGSITNRSAAAKTFNLQARFKAGAILDIKGPTRLTLQSHEKQAVNIAVIAPLLVNFGSRAIVFNVLDDQGRVIDQKQAYISRTKQQSQSR